MKKYLIITILVLLGIIGAGWLLVKHANEKWEIAMANVKAYDAELNNATARTTALLLTVDLLEYFKDSALLKLDSIRKELKIKDKNLKALLIINSGFSKVDTIKIVLTDTLFREPTLNIDTLLGDYWYNLLLGLKYPSTIAVKPYFKSEKYIVVSTKKETVNPPKKFFLFRWFLKKHKVLHVEVNEKNPYVDNESSKYVEILK